MRPVIFCALLVGFCGCEKSPPTAVDGSELQFPTQEQSEYLESLRYWQPALRHLEQVLEPAATKDPELQHALEMLSDQKRLIMDEKGVLESCKWHYARVYKKTPAEVLEAFRREKWGSRATGSTDAVR